MRKAQPSPRRFPRDRKGFRKNIIECGALSELFLELGGLAAQPVVRQRLDGRLKRVDFLNNGPNLLEFTVIFGAKRFGEKEI